VLPVGLVIPEFAISLCITLILSIRNLGLFSAAVFTATIGCALYLRTSETEGKGRQSTAIPSVLGALPLLPHIICLDFPGLDQRARTRRAPTLVRLRVRNPPPRLRKVNLLLVRPEEVVVGRVGLELSLTHGAVGGRNSSAGSVQTLDEGGVEQEVAAGWPFLVPN